MMRFTKGRATVEVDGEKTNIHCDEHSWAFFTDESDHGGVQLTSVSDADDVLSALWVAHLARQKVDEETLKIGASVQGVTIEHRRDPETERLVAEMKALPSYEGWCFSYPYLGFFCYRHPALMYTVAFTPDWKGDDQLPIEVTDEDEHVYSEHSITLPLPGAGRTGAQIFALVKPTLDKLIEISTQEIAGAIKAIRDDHAEKPKT